MFILINQQSLESDVANCPTTLRLYSSLLKFQQTRAQGKTL